MKTTQTSLFGPEYEVEITPGKKSVKLKFPKDGTPLCEFLILIEPSDSIKKVIKAQKNQLAGLMSISDEVRTAIAHVTVHNLKAPKSATDKIVEVVSEVLTNFQSFQIKLDGVGVFMNKENRTLFHKVSLPDPIISIAEAVASILPGYSSVNPHVTIGRHLDAAAVANIDKLYNLKKLFDYQGEFCCRSIVVLRRGLNPRTGYEKIAEINLLH